VRKAALRLLLVLRTCQLDLYRRSTKHDFITAPDASHVNELGIVLRGGFRYGPYQAGRLRVPSGHLQRWKAAWSMV